MKRKLLRQMLNEWRANLWLAIELLLVSVVMWYLTDRIWVYSSVFNEPRGQDITHCYKVSVNLVTDQSPEYVEYENKEERIKDFKTLVQRLEARPEIEAVSVSNNAYPYSGSNQGARLNVDTIGPGDVQLRMVNPGFIRVFRIQGADGESTEEMAQLLEKMGDHEFLASADLFKFTAPVNVRSLYGRYFKYGDDSLKLVKAYQPIRNQDYTSSEWNWSGIITPISRFDWANEIAVRVRENMDSEDFKENLMKDAVGPLRIGNYYIGSVESFGDIRRKFQAGQVQQLTNTGMVIIFLMLNIFLGVLGTFWFRTSQRTSEIALRMSVGATRRDVFNRIIAEGELLLLLVTPVAALIDWLITHYELTMYYHGYYAHVRFFGSVLITWAVLAVMIALSSFIPARRAMKISPAEALKTD